MAQPPVTSHRGPAAVQGAGAGRFRRVRRGRGCIYKRHLPVLLVAPRWGQSTPTAGGTWGHGEVPCRAQHPAAWGSPPWAGS